MAWYEVIDTTDNNHVHATTGCMDNALDVIADLEAFDKAEGFFDPERYKVRIVIEKTKKGGVPNGNAL